MASSNSKTNRKNNKSSSKIEKPADILKKWNYPGTKELEKRIKEFKESQKNHENMDNEILILDIINQIVLWKVNRQVHFDSDPELIYDIISIQEDKIIEQNVMSDDWEKNTKRIIDRMMHVHGIRLPMASTILHFFHPDTFLIIDQRAYRTICGEDMPEANKQTSDMYIGYLKKCVEYYQNNHLFEEDVPFNELDRYTYQLDKDKGNPVNH